MVSGEEQSVLLIIFLNTGFIRITTAAIIFVTASYTQEKLKHERHWLIPAKQLYARSTYMDESY